ncbi:Ubiquitin [Cricetulus griseus]|uniref:Ubiquitin n=1 Tax=Cricetulus griseus TaxID=10029 RepID=G3IKR8_CRIGR|nr:Ubiquitin [Cricetulus griseus]
MEIFSKFLKGQNITLDVQPSDSMGNVNTKTQEKEGISPDQQWLGFIDSRLRMAKS